MSIGERWRQRFTNYEKAFALIEQAVDKVDYSDLERAGLIQFFEVTYELGWNLMKDICEFEGLSPKGSKDAARMAFQLGLIAHDECEIWLDMVEKRTRFSHLYSEEDADAAVELIQHTYFPVFAKLRETVKDRL